MERFRSRDSEFVDSEIQRFRERFGNSEILRFKDPEILRFLDSEIKRIRESEIKRIRDSEIQREILRFRDSVREI